ncbi:unnamed protein product [Urochloa decumbens]|uniref:Chitin-binding type-2 domain-containing protein n=1 Tax=Urochloa decumbens TaxID=240449 RepID=A0ABC8W1U4_9POAL
MSKIKFHGFIILVMVMAMMLVSVRASCPNGLVFNPVTGNCEFEFGQVAIP